VLQDALFAESPPVLSLVTKLLPNLGIEQLASRSIAWMAMSAVRPDPNNLVLLRGEHLQINYTANNLEAHDRLVYRRIDCLKAIEAQSRAPPRRIAALDDWHGLRHLQDGFRSGHIGGKPAGPQP
jgi:hypothetical protein